MRMGNKWVRHQHEGHMNGARARIDSFPVGEEKVEEVRDGKKVGKGKGEGYDEREWGRGNDEKSIRKGDGFLGNGDSDGE